MSRRKKTMLALAGGGDDGTTGLLGGGRAAKDDLRLDAYGTIDEASSAIGLGKSLTSEEMVVEVAEEMQRGLYRLGAELATNPEHSGSFGQTGAADVARLDQLMEELESEVGMPEGFILPGTTPASAAFDLARSVVRRAERLGVTLAREKVVGNPEVVRYLNRLSLLLFVLARYEEARSGTAASLAKGRQAGERRLN
jgi:cob(I)alamin adenosyltransferase